jgi:hypothetical protein
MVDNPYSYIETVRYAFLKRKKPVSMKSENQTSPYTCREYREEMILLSLQKKLSAPDLTPEEKEQLLTEIAAVEACMGMD